MFIRAIKQRLLAVGVSLASAIISHVGTHADEYPGDQLKKYDKLVRFNEKIIAVSLSMDVLIIAMMSYRNDFV
jgi:hypothetical protein